MIAYQRPIQEGYVYEDILVDEPTIQSFLSPHEKERCFLEYRIWIEVLGILKMFFL